MDNITERSFREVARRLQGRLDVLTSDVDAFERQSELHRALTDAPLRVRIKHEAALVGDTLNTIPWMLALAARFGRKVHAGGQFSNAVKPLVVGLPICFDEIEGSGPSIEFVADIKACWNFAGPRGMHMLQGYFALSGMSPPSLPVSLPLVRDACDLPPGVVLSPFCGSEPQDPERHVRVWYVDRWHRLMDFLLNIGRAVPIYIIGGRNDDVTPFLRDGVVPIIGYPLTQVLDLMQKAELCVSIDTGTSHLAHYGCVERHLLLYPEVNFSTIHSNPRARMIRAWPADISADMVIHEAASILGQVG